jgi:hypothetical protein
MSVYTYTKSAATRRKLMTDFIERVEECTNNELAYEIAQATLITTIICGLIYCVVSLL